MKAGERALLAWCVVLVATAACTIVSPLVPWSGHRILHSATAAAWAQAAGTVAAMLSGAGAIAWQVRFETRREARAELRRDLRAALEIEELVAYSASHLKYLRVLIHNAKNVEDIRQHLTSLDDELTWHELRVAFDETVIATIPGARLKLAFIRARSGYDNSRGVYDVLWQQVHGGLPTPSESQRASLERAAGMFQDSLEQIRSVVETIGRLIRET